MLVNDTASERELPDDPDHLLSPTDELPELPDLPDVPELPDGRPEPAPGELATAADPLVAVEEQARRVQAYAEDLADLIAYGRAVAREPAAVAGVSPPQLDRVSPDVLAELLTAGRRIEAATEAAFEGAGRGSQRAAVRQHADLLAQREVNP